jgi:putative transposase
MFEYVLVFVGLFRAVLRGRGDLLAENLLLRHQLAVLTRPTRQRPRLHARDKLFWVLARRCCTAWRRHLFLVQPDTVVRWQRRGWRLLWWWRSGCPVGRPRLSAEVRELIASMARDNLWGSQSRSQGHAARS